MAHQSLTILPPERIENRIFFIRGRKVMFDRDLAELYGVDTKVLKQQVRRNRDRFPEDFMFELNVKEFENWRSQIVTSKGDIKGLRYRPYVFTESGVAMLSTVLKSKKAIHMNIQIMRAFTRLRELVASNKELRVKLEEMERRVEKRLGVHDAQLKSIFDAIQKLLTPPDEPKKNRIGFGVE
jgi:hypothetical protein